MKPRVFNKSVLIVQHYNVRLIWKRQTKTEDVKMPDRVDCSSVLWYPNHSNNRMATIRTLLSSKYILQRQTFLALTRSQDTRWIFFGLFSEVAEELSPSLFTHPRALGAGENAALYFILRLNCYFCLGPTDLCVIFMKNKVMYNYILTPIERKP